MRLQNSARKLQNSDKINGILEIATSYDYATAT